MDSFIAVRSKYTKENGQHYLHIFSKKSELTKKVANYIEEGLNNKEICVVIATPSTITELEDELISRSINLDRAKKINRFVTLDAQSMLNLVKSNDEVNNELFKVELVKLLKTINPNDKHLRAFGEAFGELLKDDKFSDVMKIENNWNKYQHKFNFSLYCAYPKKFFKASQESQARLKQICNSHNAVII